MTVALDSSVMVAALASWHARHVESHRTVAAALSSETAVVVPSHALIEAFAVFTRLPVGYRISPRDAHDLLRGAFHRRARIVEERAASAWRLMSQAAANSIAGGAVYDLRILRAARGAGATELLTLNPGDFLRFGVEDVAIVEP